MYLGQDLIVKISHQDWIGQTAVYLAIKDEHGLKVAKPIELIFEPIEEGMAPEPTLRIDSLAALELFHALADALDKQGIKTPKDANLEGILEATKYHLEDMRLLAGIKEKK